MAGIHVWVFVKKVDALCSIVLMFGSTIVLWSPTLAPSTGVIGEHDHSETGEFGRTNGAGAGIKEAAVMVCARADDYAGPLSFCGGPSQCGRDAVSGRGVVCDLLAHNVVTTATDFSSASYSAWSVLWPRRLDILAMMRICFKYMKDDTIAILWWLRSA